MNALELKECILLCVQDIEFYYDGKDGSICPFSPNNIALAYDGKTNDYTSVDDVMEDAFFDGKSLNQIADKIMIY